MIDQLASPEFAAAFGASAGALLSKLVPSITAKFLANRLEDVWKSKEPAEDTAIERAYALWVDMFLANVRSEGVDADELEDFGKALERLLRDDDEFRTELARPLFDLNNGDLPDLDALRQAWKRVDGPALDDFAWQAAAKAYRRQLQKQQLLDPELCQRLTAQFTARAATAAERLVGVYPEANIRKYADRMRKKYNVLELSHITPATADEPGKINLRDAFIAQDVREDPPPVELPRDLAARLAEGKETGEDDTPGSSEARPGELTSEELETVRAAYAARPRQPALEVLADPARRLAVFIGGPGSGKSTLMRYLLLNQLQTFEEGHSESQHQWLETCRRHFPLLIELRHFIADRERDPKLTFLRFLHRLGEAEGWALNEEFIHGVLKSAPSLVMFDGLDEIFDEKPRGRIIQEIIGFSHDYHRARVLVTSRPVGYDDHALRSAGFGHFEIQDLDDDQIKTFVEVWFGLVFSRQPRDREQRIHRVLSATGESTAIRLLSGNPMLLTIMVLIAKQQELPRERARFYEQAADVLCHIWDVNRHLENATLKARYVSLDDKKALLRRIAYRMQASDEGLRGNFIRRTDLEREIRQFFEQRYDMAGNEALVLSRVMIDHLHERNYILCLYGSSGEGIYGFVHRTLLEYFCATEYAFKLWMDPEYSIDDLLREAFEDNWEEPAWNEVLRLICGLVGERYAERLIQFLICVTSPLPPQGATHEIPRHLVLATQCLAEVGNLTPLDKTGTLLQDSLTDCLSVLTEPGMRHQFSVDVPSSVQNLLAAARQIGVRWPGRIAWIRRLDGDLRRLEGTAARVMLVELASFCLRDCSETLPIMRNLAAHDSNASVRSAALEALARIWPEDDQTLPLVRKHAAHDKDDDVRSAALEALSRAWPRDEQLLTLVRKRAAEDSSAQVRSAALASLARLWPEDKQTLPIIRRLATRDNGEYVRSAAMEALARIWPEDELTLPIIRELAAGDIRFSVRRAALETLVRVWPEDEQTLPFIRKQAAEDKSANVRSAALEVLARIWPEEEQTLPFFRQRAVEDANEYVRSSALEALTRVWPDDQETLPTVRRIAAEDADAAVRRVALEALALIWPEDPEVQKILRVYGRL